MDYQPYPLLRAAAALAFHLPGVGVALAYAGVEEAHLVAPTGVAGARLHPAEFRELLAAEAIFDASEALAERLGAPVGPPPPPTVVPLVPGVREEPGGVVTLLADPPTYAFATLLDPPSALAAAQGTQTAPPEVVLHGIPGAPGPGLVDVMRVRVVGDPDLGVSIVVLEPNPHTPFGLAHRLAPIAQAMAASCAVSELTSGPELL